MPDQIACGIDQYANQLAEGKGETLGVLVTMFANEIERLSRSESLSITVNK